MIPVLHLVATLLMAGVILYVQIVHYPLMGGVGKDRFVDYAAGHTRRTGWVVVPLMVTELGTAVWIAWTASVPEEQTLAMAGLILLGLIWLSTALLQVPSHRRLARGFDEPTHQRLVRTNWIRTVAWLARVPVAIALVL